MGTGSYISYISRRGRIESATCTTAGKTEFYRDAVGSVVMTTNYNSPIGKSQRFAAYGKELTPNSYYSNYRMGWVGSMGYRATPLPHAETYIRARHYSTTDSRWTTRDPLWPEELPYGYVGENPLSMVDFSGNGSRRRKIGPKRTKPKRKKPVGPVDSGTSGLVAEFCADTSTLGTIGQELKCMAINSSLPVCDSSNPNFNICGSEIIGTNPGYGQEANHSNWPKPARQCILPAPFDDLGSLYCCQECSMRVCCANGPLPTPKPSPSPTLPPAFYPDPIQYPKIPGSSGGPFQQ